MAASSGVRFEAVSAAPLANAAAMTCSMAANASGYKVGHGALYYHHQRLLVAEPAHHPAGGLDVGRDPAGIPVQVQVEQVEDVAAGVEQHVEELPLGAVGSAAGRAWVAAEDHRRVGVGILDGLVQYLKLADVLGRRSGPGQPDVGGLVVVLPVAHPAGAVATRRSTNWGYAPGPGRRGGRTSVACRDAHRELEETVTKTSSEPSSWSRDASTASKAVPAGVGLVATSKRTREPAWRSAPELGHELVRLQNSP